MFGAFEFKIVIKIIIKIMGVVSFTENVGLNFTLSTFVCVFEGLDDPFSCKRIM